MGRLPSNIILRGKLDATTETTLSNQDEQKTNATENSTENDAADSHARKPRLIAYFKNVRGFADDCRLDELMHELQPVHWDVVLLNETMRMQKEELWESEYGHIFAGSGHDTPIRGVGILLHKRWKPFIVRFKAVSERVAYIDVVRKGFKLRVVTAYFPHSGYADHHVQEVCDALVDIKADAISKSMRTMIGADVNAQVGCSTDQVEHHTIGKHGLDPANSRGRGQWLKRWQL